MGQANRRGTFEERKAASIAAKGPKQPKNTMTKAQMYEAVAKSMGARFPWLYKPLGR
jgi:hypothetical protein